MSPIAEADDLVENEAGLLAGCAARRAIGADEVRRLREATYRLGKVDRRLAAELFHANRHITKRTTDWSELFLELLSGFFLHYREGRYGLSTEKETILLSWLGEDTSIANTEERRLALRVLLRAAHTPERLERRVLRAVSDNLVYRSERWLSDGERSPARIDITDMQFIRRLMDRLVPDGSYQVSRAMAAFLLEIDREARVFDDPDNWRQLLIESIARHLDFDAPSDAKNGRNRDSAIKSGLSTLLGFDHHGAAGADDRSDPDRRDRERLYHDILAALQRPF